MGESLFYIVILSLIYWCYNKQFARTLVGMLMLSTVFNGVAKEVFNTQRPIGVEGIRSLRIHTAEGASFPSGHTQTAAVFFFGISALLKQKKVYSVSVIAVIVVALSRLYLGVHWPIDVIFGVLFGAAAVIMGLKLTKAWEDAQLWKGLTVVFIVLSAISLFVLDSSNYLKALGAFWAFWLGERCEDKYVGFSTEGTVKEKVMRYTLGIVTTLMVYGGLKAIFPEGAYFSGIRYFFTVFNVVFVAPWMFKKLKWSR